MLCYALLHLTPVQNFLIGRITHKLSSELKTTVEINHIDIDFFDRLELKGLMVKDRKNDTLLSAGVLTVSISDWFFFKDKPVLHYLALRDATIEMNRHDSVWNYQFVADYFASSDTSKTTKSGFEIDLKELDLANIRFTKIDGWKGEDHIIRLGSMHLLADTFDLKKKRVALRSVELTQPEFIMSDYTGERDRLGLTPVRKKQPIPSGLRWNPDGWVIQAKSVELINGLFGSDKETDRAPYTDQFDGSHLRFGSIRATMKNVLFEKDTLHMQLQLATREQCGFEVKKLAADFRFTPEMMEFRDLDLLTNQSRLQDYYVMRYHSFSDDFSHFLHQVRLEGNFINSYVHSDDIAFFALELKDWNRVIHVDGQARGTIDDLDGKHMLVESGETHIEGDISMTGLPDIDETFIDFNSRDLKTTYADLVRLIPPLGRVTQPDLKQLGRIRYRGKFTGLLSDFVTFGQIETSLGTITGDLNLKLPANAPPVYQGQVATSGFDLGRFTGQQQFGQIAFTGNVTGKGFTLKDLHAAFDGQISRIDYEGYPYQQLKIRGDFNKKLFTGQASIQDPNLQIESLVGTIDLNGAEPEFNFDANLEKAELLPLKLTREAFRLKGKFSFRFTGSDIDDFLGTARVHQASLLHDGKPLSFDSLTLHSSISDGRKSLVLSSNEVDASISGKFKLLELPKAFSVFLHQYYPAYIPATNYNSNDQDFLFEVHTRHVDPYMQLIHHKLAGFDNSTVSGHLQLGTNSFGVKVQVPEFSYDQRRFSNIQLNSNGNFDSLVTRVEVAAIAVNDSLTLPDTRLQIVSAHDTSLVQLNTSGNKALSGASIHARVTTLSDGLNVHFFPSSILLNDRKWQLEKDGEISIHNQQITVDGVKFYQGNQQITIATEPSADRELMNDVVVKLDRVNADDFLPYFLRKPRLEGLVTGEARIEDPFGKPFVNYEVKVDQFRNDGDSIGRISSNGTFDATKKVFSFRAAADNEKLQFDADGMVFTGDSVLDERTKISIRSEKFNLSMLNAYLGDIFSDIKGTANTKDLQLVGYKGHMTFTGSAHINEGSLVVNYTRCKYLFRNESILFNPDEINFGDVEVRDTLGNTGVLHGRMYHEFFDKVEFDNIDFNTDRLLVLNTTKRDNSQFYGKVIGKANFLLNGSADNMVMDISGEPSRQDSSQIYILSGNSVENGEIDYIDFIEFGKEMDASARNKLGSRILVNMNLIANPSCKIDVILDEVTGDVIKGVGTGELRISVGNKEPLTMHGRYDIQRGEYTFNFQTFLQKYFTVNSGSIVWNGDPFKANIDILAQYEASKVDFSNLSSSFRQKEDLRIVAHLTETLLKPVIDFQLQVPEGSPLKNNFEIIKRLEQFQQDKNDLNKQVTSILLFGTFINSNQGFISANSGYNVLASTIGGVVSNAISGFFNRVLQKYIKNLDFSLDVNSSMATVNNTNLQTSVQQLQAAAKSNFVYTLLNGRLIITAGLNLDYNNPYANIGRNTNLLVTPDITAEWILSKDGRVRVVAFNKTNLDVIGQRNRTGASISFRKEADRVLDLFIRTDKKKKLTVKPPPAPAGNRP